MANRDILAIGTSSGGFDALLTLSMADRPAWSARASPSASPRAGCGMGQAVIV
jgi:hypothetical protein